MEDKARLTMVNWRYRKTADAFASWSTPRKLLQDPNEIARAPVALLFVGLGRVVGRYGLLSENVMY